VSEDGRETALAGAPPAQPPSVPPPGGGGGPRHGRGSGGGPSRFGDLVRFFLRGLGQLLVTAGVVVLLFVVYEVYVTNLYAHAKQSKVHHALEHQWAKGTLSLPEGKLAKASGHGIANLYIPRFGKDYAWTIVEGHDPIDDADLEKGPAHYAHTQLPGQRGDFAIAGHRVGKGEPFLNLDHLHAGDSVIVETQQDWYVYCVLGAGPKHDSCGTSAGGSVHNGYRDPSGHLVPGAEVVRPSDGDVILPVPGTTRVSAHDARTRYLTMTTCTPKFTAEKRLIVHAVLHTVVHKNQRSGGRYDNTTPAQIEALYRKVGN
jgi:sortase A